MRLNLCVGRVLLALVPCLTISTPANAILANRVFVSARSGNDANACSSVSTPCQTFAGAVLQLNPGGEAIVLDSGGYGPVTITQAVTIEAPPGITAFIHPPSGDAITVNAGAGDTVILRGLTLNGGGGNGITANTVGQLFVERSTITGFATLGAGIAFLAPGGMLFMNDDNVSKCSFGVEVSSSGVTATAVIRRSVFSGNVYGLWAGDGSSVTATDSTASGNTVYGFLVQSTTHGSPQLSLDHAQAISNGTGLAVRDTSGTATPFLSFVNCFVTQNQTGVLIDTGTFGTGSVPGTTWVSGNAHDLVVVGTLTAPIPLK